MLIDTHCHLDRLDLAAHGGSLDAALEAARACGVQRFLCIGINVANAPTVKALAERYADVFCTVGVHPLDLQDSQAPTLQWLLDALAHPRVLAIGETGLDYHYRPQDAEQQQAAFRLHLEAARLTSKPPDEFYTKYAHGFFFLDVIFPCPLSDKHFRVVIEPYHYGRIIFFVRPFENLIGRRFP